MPLVEEWRNRPLQSIDAIISIDGIRYKESTDGRVRDKSVYGVMGIDLEGHSYLLGLWMNSRNRERLAECFDRSPHFEGSRRFSSSPPMG
jgi:transposase-like protein